jgi:hypothetical protein
MANPRKRRFSGRYVDWASPPPKPLPVFKPNYRCSIRQPILIPSSDGEMIAIMTYPYCWPTLPILVLARPWRGGHPDLGMSREMAFLFAGDWKNTNSSPTDTFLLYRITMEDVLDDRNFPPQECRPRSEEEGPCTPAFLAWLRGRRVYEYPTGAAMLADGWKILRFIECEDCLIRLF